ncbi:MAG: AAA family ATPase [Candidatus Methanoperedens sp.]|nr:AAA family ATPase [Candidatus Methanoperedens sp.]
MRQISIYGKGGAGKSTETYNLTTALASMDKRVMQIGYDHGANFTGMPLRGKNQTTIVAILRNFHTADIRSENILRRGCIGIKYVESGRAEFMILPCTRGAAKLAKCVNPNIITR